MGNSLPDWEYLPELCLLTVLEKIDEPIGRVQFGAVSKYWHSLFNTFLDIKRRSSTNLVPMLMIPSKKSTTNVYGRLAFYRPCQENWVYIDVNEDQSIFLDILFHKGLVYAIGHYNNLVWFDVNGVEDDESSKPPKLNTLILRRLVKVSVHWTTKFTIFKLILDDENGKLLEKKEVESIDGDIVFVGDNRTLAVLALDFPEGRPNSIYFTDDFIDRDTYEILGPRDIGIFHLKDGSLEKYYQFKYSHKDLSPYIWISPSKEYN
ncbi:hypothetical protein CXB51_018626 [Gossypium anomalum]|uniref:KIB1-4 beta-propeller domain-containing protein n=1 Tax=Gossypium anomalum TaxID=47600 RepID=A0A8J5YLA8_9ROSI|nr:hypothetical protein CXB51_018626 [Gossypium anomalum]